MIGAWLTMDVSEVSPRLIFSPTLVRASENLTRLLFFFLSVREPRWQAIGLLWPAFNISRLRAMRRRAAALDHAGGWHGAVRARTHGWIRSHTLFVQNEGGRWRVWCMSLRADKKGDRQHGGEGPPRNLMARSNGNSYWINNLHAEQTGPVGRLNRQTGADSAGAAGYSSSPCQLIGQQL